MDWKIFLDIVVSLLLAATIGYAVILNSRLTALRKNRDDLAKIIVAFNEATARAEASIPKLKRAAEEAGGGLQDRVEKAQSLRDDLAFMIERADTMANRLENAVRSARSEVRAQPAPAARVGSSGQGTSGQSTSGQSSSGQGTQAGASQGSNGAQLSGAQASRAAQQATVAAAAASAEADMDERSEAERELLRALQAMR